MTHADLREAVAQAVSAFLHGPEKYEVAEAALAVVAEAMREPSVAMNEAAYGQSNLNYDAVADVWRAMLAASPLAENKS